MPIKNFKFIMDELDELEDIRLYDASKEPSIPIDQAFKMIEAKRKKKEHVL